MAEEELCQMKRVVHLLSLGLLFVVVWPVHGQVPRTAAEYLDRGLAHMAAEPDAAIADFTKAIQLDPRNSAAYFNRGRILANKNNLDDAISDFSKAIDIDPRDAMAYSNRGVLRARKGDGDGAIADYNKAIEIDRRAADAIDHFRPHLFQHALDGEDLHRSSGRAVFIDRRVLVALAARLSHERRGLGWLACARRTRRRDRRGHVALSRSRVGEIPRGGPDEIDR